MLYTIQISQNGGAYTSIGSVADGSVAYFDATGGASSDGSLIATSYLVYADTFAGDGYYSISRVRLAWPIYQGRSYSEFEFGLRFTTACIGSNYKFRVYANGSPITTYPGQPSSSPFPFTGTLFGHGGWRQSHRRLQCPIRRPAERPSRILPIPSVGAGNVQATAMQLNRAVEAKRSPLPPRRVRSSAACFRRNGGGRRSWRGRNGRAVQHRRRCPDAHGSGGYANGSGHGERRGRRPSAHRGPRYLGGAGIHSG